jgi:hypothetical protein
MRLVWIGVLAVGLAGCAKLMGYGDGGQKTTPLRQYPDGADGLRQFASDVLDAAKKDDRDRVHDLLANTIMTDQQLGELLGAQAGELTDRYHKLMETLVNRGAVELVAQVYERKLDTVEVTAVDAKAKDATAEERALAAVMQPNVPVYSVRFKKTGDARGLRYDFFVYRGGKWVTGNQIAKYLSTYRPPDGGAR